jgi:iron complex outermembrane recepter protein
MSKSNSLLLTITTMLCFVLGGLPSLYAQEPGNGEFTLEEITVTAEKRVENVQKTPISVTAITGESIVENAQVTLESVLRYVPALQVQKSPQGGQIYIRGVGANGDSNWVDPSIALTLDNVYSGRAESVFAGMYDIDRVEVLRGPQGTLYGRNATGGSINVITKNPGFKKFEADGNFQVGNYSLWHFDGAVNVPISDTFGFRIALLREHRKGYYTNGGMESNPTAVRGKFLFEPTEDISMLLTLDYSHTDNLDNTTVPMAHAGGPPFFMWDTDPDNPWFVDSMHPADVKKDTFKTVSLKLDYDFDWATLTFIPAYTHSSRFVITDLIAGLFNGPGNPPKTSLGAGSTMVENQYTVEARLSSPEKSTLKWVVGSFYLTTKNQMAGDIGPSATVFTQYGNNHPASSVALFGQATYPVSDQFRVTAGLRYTKDSKSTDWGIKSIYTAPGGTPYDTGLHTMENQYTAITYKAGVEYDLNAASMIYGQISTGYKSGGFNTSSAPPTTYKPEKLMAFELGSKNRFLDNRLQVNAEAYLYNYDKYQVQYPFHGPYPIPADNVPPTADPAGQFNQYIANAETGKNYGVDLEMKALITTNDQVDVTFAYQHARYGELVLHTEVPPNSTLPQPPGPPGQIVAYSLTGTPVANTPAWSGTIGYQHSFVLPNGGVITARGQSKISDGYWATIEKHFEGSRQEGFHRSDANLSYAAASGVWSVNAWIKNIENDYQKTTIMPLWRMMISDPRTYGATISIKW